MEDEGLPLSGVRTMASDKAATLVQDGRSYGG